jgi:8-oxo-dGTP diphosphatase
MEPTIRIIKNKEILRSLENSTRQYLVGDLKKSQDLNHIQDDKIEIGITSYPKYTAEFPHKHSQAYEYQYMISGYTIYFNLESKQEFTFKKGDFYMIEPGVKYAQKSKAGTIILFIKVPPGNDKIDIEPSAKISEWLDAKIKTDRLDYTDRNDAPKPNSIRPAVAVAIFNAKNEILVLKRKDSGNWTLPGGTHEFGESLIQCAEREVKEETGFSIKVKDIIGTYSNPKTVVEYTDGEVRQEFTLVFYSEIKHGSLKIDNESTDYKWEKAENVLNLSLADSQRRRIGDVIEYRNSNARFLR